MNPLGQILKGLTEPNYDDPKYMADSWKWVQRKVDNGSNRPSMPPNFENMSDKEKADYQNKVAQHESPVSRWRRSINAMMESDNPALQEKALASWSQYQNKAATKAAETRRRENDPSNDYLSLEELKALPMSDRLLYMQGVRGLNPTADVQKMMVLAETPEDQLMSVASQLGFNNWIDTGAYMVNPELSAIMGEPMRVRKEVAQKEFERKQGIAEQEMVQNFDVSYSKDQSAYEGATYTLSELNDLADITDFTSTGVVGQLTSWIGSTPAAEWQARAKSLKATLGLEAMIKLKRESPSGSTGLGAVNLAELESLQDDFGRLEQNVNPNVAIDIMSRIYERVAEIREKIRESQASKADNYEQLYDKWSKEGSITTKKSKNVDKIRNDPRWKEDFESPLLRGGRLTKSSQGKTMTRAEMNKLGLTEEEAKADGYRILD